MCKAIPPILSPSFPHDIVAFEFIFSERKSQRGGVVRTTERGNPKHVQDGRKRVEGCTRQDEGLRKID